MSVRYEGEHLRPWFIMNRNIKPTENCDALCKQHAKDTEEWTINDKARGYTFFISRRAKFGAPDNLEPYRVEEEIYLPKWNGLTPETPPNKLRQAIQDQIQGIVPLPADFLGNNQPLPFIDKGNGDYEIIIRQSVDTNTGKRQEFPEPTFNQA